MNGTTAEILAIVLTFLLMAGLGVILLVVALRVSPRASARREVRLRRPGKRTRGGMYIVAAVHVIAGILIAIRVPGAGFGIIVVCVAAAGIYMLMAESYALMARMGRTAD